MNPGLVVKLRPSGPWRIGPDSGARNRVDVIYHSDSLYSAVTGAMSRMGSLAAWLDATARSQTPAVCFSSCFPFLDDIGFVVPPRTIWPPTSPAAMSARVRWKSARFIPLSVVESILSGKKLNENQWSVDGASACLVPAGQAGPFRTSVRWNAAVDRLSGVSERFSTACIEFREGCGLWTVVGFHDEAARDQWQEPVKAAFRLLADTGFGGERSRGWGRSEAPEFVEGTLPGLVIEYKRRAPSPVEGPPVIEPAPEPEPALQADTSVPLVGQALSPANADVEPAPETEAAIEPAPEAAIELAPETEAAIGAATVRERFPDAPEIVAAEPEPLVEPATPEAEIAAPEPAPEPEAPVEAAVLAPDLAEPLQIEPEPEIVPPLLPPANHLQAHWLLSLFTPAAADAVDWGRGSYTVLARGGRIDSPSGSGELKKQIQMVAEGSVLYADGAPLGSAADVAPDGFAHPVFRAGFALAIPLPEVH